MTSGPKWVESQARAGFLVSAVDAPVGEVLVLALEQVSHVVQERRHDEPVGSTLQLGQLGRLKRMLGLRNGLSMVGGLAVTSKEIHDVVHNTHSLEPPHSSSASAPVSGKPAVFEAGRT